MEDIALRSQLSLYQQAVINKKRPKPQSNFFFRLLWVLLSRFYGGWKTALLVVTPDTVIRWHRTLFRKFWRLKSRKRGRPAISRKTIALIKQIHKENPLLSPEKIHEQLVLLGVTDAPAPNTIAKYIPILRKPPTEKQRQSWKTFLHNHNVWSMDCLVVPTINFKVLYVFIVVSNARRKIEHFVVTNSVNAECLIQQIRNATPFGKQPKYLLHHNYTAFTSKVFQNFLVNINIKSVRTSIHSPWQNAIAERTIGILRQNLLNHIIPLNQTHLERILKEYITEYYNPHRTHQGIRCETPEPSPPPPETTVDNTELIPKNFLADCIILIRKSHKKSRANKPFD